MCNILREILKALDFIHSKGIVHKELKASRIFIGENGEVKLSICCDAHYKGGNSIVGSPYWLAPEMISLEAYTSNVDIWSLGITVFEMLFGEVPHAKENPMVAIFKIIKEEAPRLEGHEFSDEFKDFIACCLEKDAEKRPFAKQLLSHPFILNAGDTSKLKSLASLSPKFNNIIYSEEKNSSNDENFDEFNEEEINTKKEKPEVLTKLIHPVLSAVSTISSDEFLFLC